MTVEDETPLIKESVATFAKASVALPHVCLYVTISTLARLGSN